MRIAMLGLGSQPIPPVGRGAIESVIWAYAEGLRARGHRVEILNVRPGRVPLALPKLLFGSDFDWIWTHHERMVPWAIRYGALFGANVVHTSHRPVTDPDGPDAKTRRRLRMAARAGYHLGLNAEIEAVYREFNPGCRFALAPNGVDVGGFRYAARGGGRAICLGGLSKRKRQFEVARTGVDCDFVGPVDHGDEETAQVAALPSYLGAWSREETRERLTDYSALLLYSRSEAQPLVVGEAFAAGLSVVLSPEAARNEDASLPWVTIVREAREIPEALDQAVEKNAEHRSAIRAHAEAHWDWGAKVAAVEARLLRWSEET